MLIGMASFAMAQETVAQRYAETITAEDLKKDLEIIASDSLEGRETGTKGQKLAADYIANHFKAAGLKVQEQVFELRKQATDTSMVIAQGKQFNFMEDFYFFPGIPSNSKTFTEIVFLGYGIEDSLYSDFVDSLDLTGKAVVILNGEPINRRGDFLLTGTTSSSDWSKNYNKKIDLIESKGAAALFIIDSKADKNMKKYSFYLTRETLGLKKEEKRKDFMPAMFVSEEMADELLNGKIRSFEKAGKKIGRKGKNQTEIVSGVTIDMKLKTRVESIKSSNILGYLEGSDLKEEIIVITAHYDHLGKKGEDIYNGADDDGSGTVAVLELADAFAKAKKEGKGPRRSILFMCVSGEEKGLLGSEYYTENPIYPLAQTVCNLNIDMIGRVDKEHKKNPEYVYLIGSDKLSSELHEISEKANETYTQIELDYTYNATDDPNRYYYRSDHYNFAKNNIPVIFYFSGTHKDYHKPTDTVDKIEFEKMTKITQLVFYTAWDIANRGRRLVLDLENDFEN